MWKHVLSAVALLVVFGAAVPVIAHFQAIVPDVDVVTTAGPRAVAFDIIFTHPMERQMMDMEKPEEFGVVVKDGKPIDLTNTLHEVKLGKFRTWKTEYKISKPGDHIFYVKPKPYWEPAEDCFIIHYTKVCVNAFGLEQGWDTELNLPVEIVPLVRPYGLWAGNVFRGIVKKNGKPVPFAEIEVEYYNEPGEPLLKPPTDAHITQVIKADSNGVFCYAMPRAGWWVFAALVEADYKLKHNGESKVVELGAVFWVKTYEMK